jgi:hypothetical protein
MTTIPTKPGVTGTSDPYNGKLLEGFLNNRLTGRVLLADAMRQAAIIDRLRWLKSHPDDTGEERQRLIEELGTVLMKLRNSRRA